VRDWSVPRGGEMQRITSGGNKRATFSSKTKETNVATHNWEPSLAQTGFIAALNRYELSSPHRAPERRWNSFDRRKTLVESLAAWKPTLGVPRRSPLPEQQGFWSTRARPVPFRRFSRYLHVSHRRFVNGSVEREPPMIIENLVIDYRQIHRSRRWWIPGIVRCAAYELPVGRNRTGTGRDPVRAVTRTTVSGQHLDTTSITQDVFIVPDRELESGRQLGRRHGHSDADARARFDGPSSPLRFSAEDRVISGASPSARRGRHQPISQRTNFGVHPHRYQREAA